MTSLKEQIQRRKKENEIIEKTTESKLWREGARWSIRTLEDVLGLLDEATQQIRDILYYENYNGRKLEEQILAVLVGKEGEKK